jgi:hypothetical protein
MAGDKRRMKIIHGLDYAMRIMEATDEMLGVRAGISHATVSRARSGIYVLHTTAFYIVEALRSTQFKYQKRGPRYIRAQKGERKPTDGMKKNQNI